MKARMAALVLPTKAHVTPYHARRRPDHPNHRPHHSDNRDPHRIAAPLTAPLIAPHDALYSCERTPMDVTRPTSQLLRSELKDDAK